MYAKLTEDEIAMIEELVADRARDLAPDNNSKTRNLLGRISNICYLNRAEIRMKKRIHKP